MPRLDTSSFDVVGYYDLPYDQDDPGDTPPVDLCLACWLEWEGHDGENTDHPAYEDGEYFCFDCGEPLVPEDNDPI